MKNEDSSVFCFNCGAQLKTTQGIGAQGTGAQSQSPQNVSTQAVNPQNVMYTYVPYPGGSYGTERKRRRLTPNVAGIICASLLLIACFLPFVSVGYKGWGKSYTFIETGWGVIAFLGAITAIVFSVLDIKWGIIGPGIGSLASFVIAVISILSNYNSKGLRMKDLGDLLGELLHMNVGFFAVPILSIALMIFGTSSGGFYDEDEEKNTNSYISKLRDEGNSSGSWKCFNCGTQNALYIGTCKCGVKKTDERNIVIQPTIKKSTAPSSGRCPSCGKVSDGSRNVCFYCGGRLIK